MSLLSFAGCEAIRMKPKQRMQNELLRETLQHPEVLTLCSQLLSLIKNAAFQAPLIGEGLNIVRESQKTPQAPENIIMLIKKGFIIYQLSSSFC
jgi:hypothetical protein